MKEPNYNLTPAATPFIMFVAFWFLFSSTNILVGTHFTFADIIGCTIPFMLLAIYGNVVCNLDVVMYNDK